MQDILTPAGDVPASLLPHLPPTHYSLLSFGGAGTGGRGFIEAARCRGDDCGARSGDMAAAVATYIARRRAVLLRFAMQVTAAPGTIGQAVVLNVL